MFDITEQLQVTFSARADRNEISETNIQPSLRLLWLPTENDRIWLAGSKASSTPPRSIIDVDHIYYAFVPAQPPALPLPLILQVNGHDATSADTQLRALELGYRHTFDNFNFDIALFDFNYYNDVSVTPTGLPQVQFDENFIPSYLLQNSEFTNNQDNTSQGIELSTRGQFNEAWSIQISYSYLDNENASGWDSSFSLLNSLQVNSSFRFNLWVRSYKGNAVAPNFPAYPVQDYAVLDLNLNWRLTPQTQVNLAFYNLGEKHSEAIRDLFAVEPAQIEPYVIASASLSF